jgi:hypothetical protein
LFICTLHTAQNIRLSTLLCKQQCKVLVLNCEIISRTQIKIKKKNKGGQIGLNTGLQILMYNKNNIEFNSIKCDCFGSTYTKIGRIQRKVAWPLRKDGTQNREAFHIFGIAPSISVQSLTLFISPSLSPNL